jgi:hypothetical protein
MRQTAKGAWGSWVACAFLSPLSLILSTFFFFGALSEAFANFRDGCRNVGADCHDPNELLMLGEGVIGLALLVLAVVALLRFLVLLVKAAQLTLGSA